jgi:hypothetical protein
MKGLLEFLAIAALLAVSVTNTMGQDRLVFSNTPIDPENLSNVKVEFNAGEHIYGLLLLSRPMKDFVREFSVRHPQLGYSVDRPAIEIELLVDGVQLFSGRHLYVWDIENRTSALESVPNERYLFFDIAPEIGSVKTYKYPKMFFGVLSSVGRKDNRARAGAQYYSHQISHLTAGNHKVSFKISGKDVIEGGFNIRGSDFSFYSQIANSLDEVSAENTTLPDPRLKDVAIEASIKTAVRNHGNRDSILAVIITNPDWYVQRNSLGTILYRALFATVVFKGADGNCYFVQEYFKQIHSNGRFGPTVQDGRSEARVKIPCQNVKQSR